MNAAELAALIAAVFWALLVCVGVFVLFRLSRLLSESSKLVTDLRERGDVLLTRAQLAVDGAQQAVDRAGRQLDRTESVTASMDELGAGMSELAGQVTAPAASQKPLRIIVPPSPWSARRVRSRGRAGCAGDDAGSWHGARRRRARPGGPRGRPRSHGRERPAR